MGARVLINGTRYKTFVDPRRSSEKDRAYEEENGDRGSEEGYDF